MSTCMQQSHPSKWLDTPSAIELRDFIAKTGAKIRRGFKHTIDTSDPEAEVWPERSYPVIEIHVKERKGWLMLTMPDGGHYFADADEQTRVWTALTAARVNADDNQTDKETK